MPTTVSTAGSVHLLLGSDSHAAFHDAVQDVANDAREAAATIIEDLPFAAEDVCQTVVGPRSIGFLVRERVEGDEPDKCRSLPNGGLVYRLMISAKPTDNQVCESESKPGSSALQKLELDISEARRRFEEAKQDLLVLDSTRHEVEDDDPVIAELQAITSMPTEEIIAALSKFPADAMNDAGENRMQLAMGVLMPYIADEAPEDQHHYRARRICEQAEQVVHALEMQREQVLAVLGELGESTECVEEAPVRRCFEVEGQAVLWELDGQPVRCHQIAAMTSALVGIVDGQVKLWPWASEEQLDPETSVVPIGDEPVVQLGSSLLRCSVLSESGKIATFHDACLAHPLAPGAQSVLEHGLEHLHFPADAGKVVHVAASSKLFSLAATDTGHVYFWGRRPCDWRRAVVAARDEGSAAESTAWLGGQAGTAVDAMDEYFVWFTATVLKRSPDGASVLIQFDGWDAKWNEWMPVCGGRLAPLHTHTIKPTHGSKGGVCKPPKQGCSVEAKLSRDAPFQPATVVVDSTDNNNLKVQFVDSSVHVLRLSAYQIRLARTADGTPLSPLSEHGLQEGAQVLVRREELYEPGALALLEGPGLAGLSSPTFLKLKSAISDFDSACDFEVIDSQQPSATRKLKPASVLFLTPTAARRRGQILKMEPSGVSALVKLESDEPGAAAEQPADVLQQCHIIGMHKLTRASALQESSEMTQEQPHLIFSGVLTEPTHDEQIHPHLEIEIKASKGQFRVSGLVATGWDVQLALQRAGVQEHAGASVVQWCASMNTLQWQATIEHLAGPDPVTLRANEHRLVVPCAQTQPRELVLCSAAIVPTAPLAALGLGSMQVTTEASAEEPPVEERREDPALREIRSLLEAEEFSEVEELLDGFEMNRREHITCLLRMEQELPLGLSGLHKASTTANKEPEACTSSAAVVVFSGASAGLQQMHSGTMSADALGELINSGETFGAGQNALHLLAAHPDEAWAAQCMRPLLTAPQASDELIRALLARDSGGRTPFFVSLETGSLCTSLLLLEKIEFVASTDEALWAAMCTSDLSGTPPLHALLGLSIHGVRLGECTPEGASACAELVERMLLLHTVRNSRDLNGLSALEAFTAFGPTDREQFAVQCAGSLHAVQAALVGECAAVDAFVWNLLSNPSQKQQLSRAVISTTTKLFSLGIAQMESTAERWVQAVVRVLTTIFAGAPTRDTSDALREALVGALHFVPEAAIKALSQTASSVLKPMRLGMPLLAAEQPATHKTAAEIGRASFGGQPNRRPCAPASSCKPPAVTVLASSSQRTADNVLSADPERFWQSNGQMNTHWLELEVSECGNELESLEICCSAAIDDSYCPQEVRVSIGAPGEGVVKALSQDGWTELLDGPLPTPFCLHIAFVRTRGHNIKLRQIRLGWSSSCSSGGLSGTLPNVPELPATPEPAPSVSVSIDTEAAWIPTALSRKLREAGPQSTAKEEPPQKKLRQDPRIVCASTFNFLVRTMVEIYKSAFVAKDDPYGAGAASMCQSHNGSPPKSPTTMGILNKARGALRSKRIEDAMLCAGYQLDSSWEWIFHVMDSTQAHLAAADLREQQRPSASSPNTDSPELQGGLLACLRAAHGDVLSVAPNVTEHNYGHVAIVLDAIVAWQSCGVQEWLHKDRMMRNVSHLRKVTDPVAEIAREHVEARSPPREAITSQPWKEQGLVDILARWEKAIAKFANEFSEAEAVVGPDSFLHLMASYEMKEKRFRTEMAQLRREKCEGRKLLFNVSRDTSHNIFEQVSGCMDLRYTEAVAQNHNEHKQAAVPVLAVQTLVAKFEGELGEGSALLRSCLAQVAKVLRFDKNLLISDQDVDGDTMEHDAQEQLRHFSPSPSAVREPERLQKFRNVGRLLGLSLLFDCRLPVFFHRHVYKYLLGRRVSLADLAYYKGEVYTSMTNLIKTIAQDPSFDISTMSLEFSAQWTPDGNAIPVTRNNWAAYVRRFAKGEMIDGVKLELENLKLGLLDVVPEISLQGLTAEDLQLLLAGKSGNVTVQDFVGRVHFTDSRTAQGRENDPNELADLERCMWAVLEMFSVDERLALIAFGTGTPVLPEELGFHLEDPPSSSAAGPFARQCENYITIPSYASLDEELLANVLRNAARTTVRYDTI